MPPKPDPEVAAHVKAARRQAAERLLREEIAAERNAAIITILKDNPDHPATADTATDATEKATEAKAKTNDLITKAGLSRSEIVSGIKAQRKAELSDQILQWKAQRDIHKDFVENPDIYGGEDLGGAPLDAEVQKRMVAEYDAAIAAAEAEKAGL